MQTKIIEPNSRQLTYVAELLEDRLLRDCPVDHVAKGIRRIRVNEVGDVCEVYISQGLFVRLCQRFFGDRTRRAFDVCGFRVKSWKPNADR